MTNETDPTLPPPAVTLPDTGIPEPISGGAISFSDLALWQKVLLVTFLVALVAGVVYWFLR